MDGSPGWNPWTTREQRGRHVKGRHRQDLDSRGEHRVGEEMRGTGELQVKILWENAVLQCVEVRGAAWV